MDEDWLDIASRMLGNTDSKPGLGIPQHVFDHLQNVAVLVEASGGQLRSRQVIAQAIATAELFNTLLRRVVTHGI